MISALSPFYRGQLSVSSIGYKSENNIKDNQKYEVWVHQSAHMYMSQDPIFKAGKWLRIAGCHCHHTDGRVYINHIGLTWQYTRWMIDSVSLSPCVCITYWRSHLGLYWLSQSLLVLFPCLSLLKLQLLMCQDHIFKFVSVFFLFVCLKNLSGGVLWPNRWAGLDCCGFRCDIRHLARFLFTKIFFCLFVCLFCFFSVVTFSAKQHLLCCFVAFKNSPSV